VAQTKNLGYTYLSNIAREIKIIPKASIVSKTLLNNESIKVLLFGFATNQELSEHTASMPAIIHLLDGKADITLGDTYVDADVGDWIFMPPNLSHSVYAKTPLKMLLYLLKNKSGSE